MTAEHPPQRLPPLACWCICGMIHPDDEGICEVLSPVTSRVYDSPLFGVTEVPLCAPCAVAQGLIELEGTSE